MLSIQGIKLKIEEPRETLLLVMCKKLRIPETLIKNGPYRKKLSMHGENLLFTVFLIWKLQYQKEKKSSF